jgi:hypothetical protein
MITNIIQTYSGYRAIIDGQEWTIPNDSGNRFWQMVQDAIASGVEVTIEPPPPPPSNIPNLSFAQLIIGLVIEQWISRQEGEAWLQGILPAQVQMLISTLPEDQQFIALARASRPSVIMRDDPLVDALSALQQKTPEDIDQFFITYSGV